MHIAWLCMEAAGMQLGRMHRAWGSGGMPSNKLVLHPVDEAVISFPWPGGGDEILQVNVSQEKVPTGRGNVKAFYVNLRGKESNLHTRMGSKQSLAKGSASDSWLNPACNPFCCDQNDFGIVKCLKKEEYLTETIWGLQSLNYLLSSLLQRKFADPCFECCH